MTQSFYTSNESEDCLVLPVFPLPPSTNNAYVDLPFFKGGKPVPIRNYNDLMRHVGCRRSKSKEAERYQQVCAALMNETGMTTRLRDFVEQHITVDLWMYVYRPKWLTIGGLPNRNVDETLTEAKARGRRPNKNAGDVDNRVKILQDVIFKCIGIDDACVFFSGVRKMPGEDERVVVVVRKTPDVIDEF